MGGVGNYSYFTWIPDQVYIFNTSVYFHYLFFNSGEWQFFWLVSIISRYSLGRSSIPCTFFYLHGYVVYASDAAESVRDIHGVKVNRTYLSFFHLLHAGDATFIYKVQPMQDENLLKVIQTFCSQTGEIVNWAKFVVLFCKNMLGATRSQIGEILSMGNVITWDYLGQPIL